MPLDTGAFADKAEAGQAAPAARPKIVLDPTIPIGAALRTARQTLGLSLIEISESTRVRERHLTAIEAGQIDQLPSRPFTIGYVRAYAKALGLDADATAARYRAEFPSPDDELHTPVGVQHNKPARSKLWLALGGAAVLAIVGWNVAVHVMARPAPPAPVVPSAHAMAVAHANSAQNNGPFAVDTPLPAPPEATAPAPYVTPVANTIGAPTVVAKPDVGEAKPFVAQGTVYGTAAGASSMIIQARKSISLEVRGPGGVVYFARQLAAGEAYRVPALPGLTAQVSNPADAELFVGGVSRGPFTQDQMPLNIAG
ncbi:MAG TPA: helix-turn-helix transcriptional regulator [Caulobacteraceae bacterium]|nr:helix-turn-helix transcriptional regulator [Caulobacteraceae bacterium]